MWNEKYQMTSVTSTASSISYSYDVLGRRIGRIENGVVERYVYSGDQVVADLDGNGNVIRTYIWGPGIDNLLSMTVHGSSVTNTYYALKDQQNSVMALVDASGNIVESYAYDAYGHTTIFDSNGATNFLLQSAVGNRYMWQGRELDAKTGLYYFRARWYSPGTGRWLSKDPIGIGGGLNLYVFCGNNPVNFVDPSGQAPASCSGEYMARQNQLLAIKNILAHNESLPKELRNALENAVIVYQNTDRFLGDALGGAQGNQILISHAHWGDGTGSSLDLRELLDTIIHEGLHQEGRINHPEEGWENTPFAKEVDKLVDEVMKNGVNF